MKLKFLKMAFLFLVLSPMGCSLYQYSYENTVQQGNMFTEEDLNKITIGMAPEEVIQILGTPVLMDVFNESSLNYIYYLRVSHKMQDLRRVAFYFVDQKLDKIDLHPL